VKLFDLHSGKRKNTLLGHQKQLMSAAMSEDGKLLATGAFAGEKLKIWDLIRGSLVGELGQIGQYHELISLAFSKDGQTLAVSGVAANGKSAGTVELWNVTARSLTAVLMKESVERFYPGSLRFSPDGKHLMAGIQNKMHGVMIWDVMTRKLVKTIPHGSDVVAIDLSPDGSRIAGGDLDKVVYVWDAHRGNVLTEMRGHRGHITGVSFHPRGRFLASSSHGDRFRVWDTQSGKLVFVAEESGQRSKNVMFSKDGKTLAVVFTTYGNLGDPITLEVYDVEM
jgi:WD40 repeat protein